MRIREIFDHILLRSGQFIMSKSKIELDEDRFKLLVAEALAQYSKYSPCSVHLFIEATNNRTITFSCGNTSGRGEPDEISSVTPIRIIGVSPYALRTIYGIPGAFSDLDVRQEVPYEYRKPNLTVPYPGEFDVLAIYRHKVVERTEESGEMYMCVPTIELRDDAFFKLLRGMFLEGLGRSRRAFTLNDLPIVMDADTIAQEGRDMITEATEQMHKESKFYLAFGG